MARSVADAAAVLTAIAGRDDADPATATMPGRAVYDYTARLDPRACAASASDCCRHPC